MPKGNPAVPTCGHPDRRVKGHGKCEKCYDFEYYRKPDKAAAARARSRQWRKDNVERARRNDYVKAVEKRYGISIEEYERRCAEQNYLCILCGEPQQKGKRLCVDHCHDTGAVRGLLCVACNSGLGQFRDNPELLEAAARYVRHYRGRAADAA